jgi:hypothetical protein
MTTVVALFTVYTQTCALLCSYTKDIVATGRADSNALNILVGMSNYQHVSAMLNARHAAISSAGLHILRCRNSRTPSSGS